MKILKTLTIMLMFSISTFAQTKQYKVVQVNSTHWTVRVQETHEVPNMKPAGAVVGGGVGWLLIGGPVGLLGGALLGSAVSEGSHTVTQWVDKTVYGYNILLSNNVWYRTTQTYKVNQTVIPENIKVE